MLLSARTINAKSGASQRARFYGIPILESAQLGQLDRKLGNWIDRGSLNGEVSLASGI